jgi:hypothetical protein
MSTPGDGTPDPADGDKSADTARPARRRRAVLVLAAVAAVLVVLGYVAVRIVDSQEETGPLDAEAPHLADFTFRPGGKCRYEPALGGLVAHFDVRARGAGRFTIDLAAVTDDDSFDVPPTHVVRYTVPFFTGQTRQEFYVVVPVTEADYQDGFRKCRYTINPTGA